MTYIFQSAEEFVRLRNSEDANEYLLAAQGEAPLQLWLEIIERFPEMRFWVAQNKTVPIEILGILSQDSDLRVRRMVASKRKLSKELFERLASDPDESVRARIASNANTPVDVRTRLLLDPDEDVREAARRRLEND